MKTLATVYLLVGLAVCTTGWENVALAVVVKNDATPTDKTNVTAAKANTSPIKTDRKPNKADAAPNKPTVAPNNKDGAPSKIEGRYVGTWQTTKSKKLHGTANCIVKQISDEHWQGRFWGMWEHVDFDYTVEFCGDPVTGTATIDGAEYQWTGTLTQDVFKIQFTGSRYEGSMDLKRIDGPATVIAAKETMGKATPVK
ncbi:MAG TPA: hypothetical protein VFE46_18525 [Pirellulales bacterium]|jgi:hypothetical protein|nr:hypothetical protein [Pirellulales bacterium]